MILIRRGCFFPHYCYPKKEENHEIIFLIVGGGGHLPKIKNTKNANRLKKLLFIVARSLALTWPKHPYRVWRWGVGLERFNNNLFMEPTVDFVFRWMSFVFSWRESLLPWLEKCGAFLANNNIFFKTINIIFSLNIRWKSTGLHIQDNDAILV